MQVGDVVLIREKKSGIDKQFYIKQIDEEISADDIKQTLRLEQFKLAQDFLFGLSSINAPVPNQANTGQGQTSLFGDISIAGTMVVQGGRPLTNGNLEPIVAQWDGGDLNISIGLVTPPANSNTYIWRWIYIAEDVYSPYLGGLWQTPELLTGNANATAWFSYATPSPSPAEVLDLSGTFSGLFSSSTLPYDFRSNIDSSSSRRYFRPLLRPSSWISNDGLTAYNTATTLSDTWAGGPGVPAGLHNYLYGNLRIAQTNQFNNTSAGFVGVELFAPATQAAILYGITSDVLYGVDFGLPLPNNTQLNYAIQNKKTACYLGILCANDAGVICTKRIPFQLSI